MVVKQNEEVNDTILADVFEAFIGAYYLDYGYAAVYKLLKDIMLEDLVNFDLDWPEKVGLLTVYDYYKAENDANDYLTNYICN